jgi:hypothetical protein
MLTFSPFSALLPVFNLSTQSIHCSGGLDFKRKNRLEKRRPEVRGLQSLIGEIGQESDLSAPDWLDFVSMDPARSACVDLTSVLF